MIALDLLGIGLVGPGLVDWANGRDALADASRWQSAPTVVPAPTRLPANERRRAGTVIKASVAVADQAVAMAAADPLALATVFTSSTGDPANCHALCEALAQPERLVSPTRFTNSVHNASAGYWHIATHSMAPSTSIAAFDASFGAGLLEAATQVAVKHAAVLLVACDVPYPEPLHALRPLPDTFAVALVLARPGLARSRRAPWRLQLSIDEAAVAPSTCADSGFETLRRQIPAARALPLLQALAAGPPRSLHLEAAEGMSLHVQVMSGA